MDNLPFVRETVQKYQSRGVVLQVENKPKCVSPLTVSLRHMPMEELKKRLCLDLSRWINLALLKEAVTLPSLDKAIKSLLPGDYMATYDLSSAYHHVMIHPEHWTYLGFSVPQEDGSDNYYVFTCMPFGLSSATHCLARLTKPLCSLLAKKGIRNTIYIDDGWVAALLKLIAQQHLRETLRVLEQAGFIIAQEKTDKPEEVSQIKEYLGFSINSINMTISASEYKISKCRTLLIEAVQEKEIGARRLAKVIGKAISLELTTGPVVQLLTRAAQAELAQTVEASHWAVTVILSQEARDSLELLASVLPEFNGHAIKNESNAIRLNQFLGQSEELEGRNFYGEAIVNPTIVASDASNVAACAYDVENANGLFVQAQFSTQEKALSSGHRELLAVLAALRAGHRDLRHTGDSTKTVFWLTDSMNLVSFLTKGSSKPHIQSDVLAVFRAARELRINLYPVHLHREDYRIQVADFGSRYYDPDDWTVDNASYISLTQDWRPTIDLFAHFSNAKCERFYSYGKAPHTSGVDAFAQEWHQEVGWCCPPTRAVIPALQKIELSIMKAILIVPAWTSSAFWPFLFPDGHNARQSVERIQFFRPFLWRGEYCRNRLMQGYTSFGFLALYINSRGQAGGMNIGNVACPPIPYFPKH